MSKGKEEKMANRVSQSVLSGSEKERETVLDYQFALYYTPIRELHFTG